MRTSVCVCVCVCWCVCMFVYARARACLRVYSRARQARSVLGLLLREVPWHGPVYLEAFRLEEASEDFPRARAVVRRGLANIPR